MDSILEREVKGIVSFIEREILSPVTLAMCLLHNSQGDREAISQIVRAAKSEELQRVYDILSIYPWTDFGWSILPASRSDFRRSDLSSRELGDLSGALFQEDRPVVEYLRTVLKPAGSVTH